jgi:hypothetical protein
MGGVYGRSCPPPTIATTRTFRGAPYVASALSVCADVNFCCPHCGSGKRRRSPPRYYHGIRIALTRSKPYRCVVCRTRRGGGLNRCCSRSDERASIASHHSVSRSVRIAPRTATGRSERSPKDVPYRRLRSSITARTHRTIGMPISRIRNGVANTSTSNTTASSARATAPPHDGSLRPTLVITSVRVDRREADGEART